MESEGFWSVVTGLVGAIAPGLGGGGKKTKAQLASLSQKVDLLQAENVKQSKTITYLLIGLGVVIAVVVLIVVLKKRRR
jgi:hypothetical protein